MLEKRIKNKKAVSMNQKKKDGKVVKIVNRREYLTCNKININTKALSNRSFSPSTLETAA